jgi:WD40 repeat protein
MDANAAAGQPPDRAGFDVFLSYNRLDETAVRRIASKLSDAGLEPWLDAWCVTAGARWQDELAAGLRAASACAVFIGPQGLGDWAREEIQLALDRAAKDRGFRVFPVLLPGLAEPFDASTLPPFLGTRTWVDLRTGFEPPHAFQRLINAIKGVASGPPQATAKRDDICPYLGLRPFDEDHAVFFFGRDGDVQRLIEKLKAARFLAVLGPSGSGKSSVVRAGLVPALRKGALPDSGTWTVRVLTPGASPLATLAANVLKLSASGAMSRTVDGLAADPRTLHLAITLAMSERPSTERVLWVIDQFEETFTLCRDDAERRAFLGNLLYAAAHPDGRSIVVLTLRADFYPRCAEYPELSAQIAAHQYLVGPMGLDGLRQAIEVPAWGVGLELEAGLADTILEDIGTQTGSLPLLEHALLELWRRRRGRLLTLEAYREAGGVAGAVAQRAEGIFESQDTSRQAIARNVLLRLTQPGDGTEDTRRRALLSEIVARPEDADAVASVVGALADARLLTTGADEETGRGWVEVAHEALIRSWPRLRAWIDEDRAGLRIHRRLTEAADEWQRLGRDEGLLFRSARLAEAVEWRERNEARMNAAERAFLDASVSVQQRERIARERRRRQAMAALSIGLIIAVSLGTVAAMQWRRADNEARVAVVRQLLAQAELARTERADAIEASVLLAIEAMRQAPSPEADQVLRRGIALLPRPAGSMEHDARVTHVAFSNDMRYLATVAINSIVRVWQTLGQRSIAELRHDGPVNDVAFSPDVRRIATASDDGTARIWQLDTGREVARVVHDTIDIYGGISIVHADYHPATLRKLAGINALAFSLDGRYFATAGEDSTARVWDVNTNRQVARLAHRHVVEAIAFDPRGRYVATGSEDGTARLWTLPDGREHARFDFNNRVIAVAFTPNGEYLAAGTSSGTTELYGVVSRQRVAIMPHEAELTQLAVSPDGDVLATSSQDSTARLWAINSGNLLAVLRHEDAVGPVRFSPDGDYLVTASQHMGRVWRVSDGSEITRLLHEDEVIGMSFGSDRLATGSADGKVRLWQVSPGDGARFFGGDVNVTRVAFSANGKRLATVAGDDVDRLIARVFDIAARRDIGNVSLGGMGTAALTPSGDTLITAAVDSVRFDDFTHDRSVGAIYLPALDGGPAPGRRRDDSSAPGVFSADGRYLATTLDDSTWIWRLDGVSVQRIVSMPKRAIAFSADGRFLASATGDSIRLMEVESQQLIGALLLRGGPFSLAVNSDPRFVATPSLEAFDVEAGRRLVEPGNVIGIYDFRRGRKLRELRPTGTASTPSEQLDVVAIALTPDGDYLATIAGGAATIFETATGKQVFRIASRGLLVAFTPDGRSLATVEGDTVVLRLWRPADLIDDACGRLTRNLTWSEWRQYFGDGPYRKTCANVPAHASVAEAGRALARTGDTRAAEAILRQARAAGDSALDPRADAKRFHALGMVEEGERLLQEENDVTGAIAEYARAKATYPSLAIPAWSQYRLCLAGALAGMARDVLEECEGASALEPGNVDFRDSRGIARAITGNRDGAIEDFRFVADWIAREAAREGAREPGPWDDGRKQREEWILALRAGRNPFDDETLRALRRY